MEPSTHTILTLMILLLWECVSIAPRSVNPVFKIRTPTPEVAAQLLTSMSMTFAPGLLTVLQASTPPTVDFFKSLPTIDILEDDIWWADYAIVLEKPGFRSIIYIGSGTQFEYGIHRRLKDYDCYKSLPLLAQAALENGFVITHKGLLCWTRCPGRMQQFHYSMVFLALEAVFTVVFWAIRCSTDYGFSMTAICLWPRDLFEYDGACGHSSLNESPRGIPDLSEEQYKEIESERLETRRQYVAQWREENSEKIAAYREEEKAYLAQAEKYKCTLCNYETTATADFDKHLTSYKHIKAIGIDEASTKAAIDEAKKYICQPCGYSTDRKGNLAIHLTSEKHREATKKLEKAN